ncbi:calcium-binding protein [Pseudomethylobacillus aquaticus]|uniref:Calcium-binding protein n=1 Tax=Pseudomethylobacillus aquaticus TaxID=2676064 RepID=A0A3N0UYU9_9PROT|nr:calcium-binding protein [Pseudomethylobacillus aquaticus]ROH85542.1 calcium-binding protein [Pseudomethylobacillus aquaticus]
MADPIIGTEMDDVLPGTPGDDVIIGGAGNDELSGGDGNDVLNGGEGDDTINGGNGNDMVEAYNLATDGSDQIDLGADLDLVNVSSTGASQIRLSFTSTEVGNGSATESGLVAGQDGGLAVRIQAEDAMGDLTGNIGRADDEGIAFAAPEGTTFDVRDISGTQRGDRFNLVVLGTQGTDMFNTVPLEFAGNVYANGGAGDDVFRGGAGDDLAVGGGGHDVVESYDLATGGTDSFIGGAGDDVFNISATGSSQIRVSFTSAEVGNGNVNDAGNLANQDGGLAVRLQAEDALGNLTGNVGRADDEGISFVAGAGTTLDVRDLVSGVARGDQFKVATLGTNGNDVFDETGETVNYYINAGAGNDSLVGGNGNDFLVGGAGNDTLNGGNGNDSFIGGGGNDLVLGRNGNDVVAAYNLATDGVDRMNLGAGDDIVNVSSTGASQIRVSFTSAEVGNGNANDAGVLANQDGSLAVRLQAEDALGNLTGNVGRADDEGISFVAGAGTTLDVRDLVSGVARGDQFKVATLGTNGNDVFDETGETVNYYINAGAGNDSLVGGDGNDFLVGGAGNDSLFGGFGNDSFIGGGGDDLINGGAGHDVVAAYNLATDGVDQIDLGADDDTLNVSATGASQIRVTFTSAEVGNGNANDAGVLANQDGGLAVRLQAEDALGNLTGNVGRADDEGISFVAGAGTTLDVRDLTNGAARGDQFKVATLGSNANDVFNETGETVNYYINAGAGNDSLTGGSGNDFLVGGAGNDSLNGGIGNDSFIGGGGNDLVLGGVGNDTVVAYNLASDGADRINLGSGDDIVNVSSTGASQVRVTFTSAEVGNAKANDGNSLANQDGGFAVRLQAEDALGNLTGNVGRADDEGISFVAGAGTTLDVRDLVSGVARGDQFKVATLGTNGNDVFDETGETVNYYINAGAGNDSLVGGDGNDFLVGGAGNDTLNGGNGNDSFIGGGGNDLVLGRNGNDVVAAYNLATDGVDRMNLGAGDDIVNVSSTGASQIRVSFTSAEVGNGNANDAGVLANQDGSLAVRLQAEDGLGNLTGNVGRADDEGISFVAGAGTTLDVRDLVSGVARGDQFKVATLGTNGNDVFDETGETVNYYINAGAGNDSLVGGDGNDFLVGGAGNDSLFGGFGNDSFIGGGGSDVFVDAEFSTGQTLALSDTIFDFTTAVDTIDTEVEFGVQIVDGSAFADFDAFLAAADESNETMDVFVAFNAAGSGNAWVYVDHDQNGDINSPDSIITLVGINTAAEIAVSDFV